MPTSTAPLTASELRHLRVQMQQTPRSMAELLGVRLPRYYQWEREGKISIAVSLAVRFLATQDPPAHKPLPARRARSYSERFQPGTRIGRLVVLQIFRPGLGMNLRIAVQCDCGAAKTWQANMLDRYHQCSTTCALADTPVPDDADAPAPAPDPAPASATAPTEEWEAGL